MTNKTIRNILLGIGALLILVFVYFYFFHINPTNPPVKKSTSAICHEKGTLFYKNTKTFTPYNSLPDCLNSGGRLPKK
jgi:hypothetical protein